MTNELKAASHECLLQQQDKRVRYIVVTSTNVNHIIRDFVERNQLTWEQAFISMYKSTSPVYHLNFLSARVRVNLDIAIRDKPKEIDEKLRQTWDNFISGTKK